jgi:putative ABC transport system permease protein
METLLQDARYGLRMLLGSPVFTIIAVITLALGIGANSAIFSVVNAILLRPLHYEDPERLVLINHNYPRLNLRASVSAFGYVQYRNTARSFENMAAMTTWPVNLTGAGEPQRLNGLWVTANFFQTLKAGAAMGRVFAPGEDERDRNRVVVLGHAFWQRQFAGDPGILDKTVTLNGESYTVVGVMPADFQFGREIGQIIDLWGPIAFTPQQLSPNSLTNEFLSVMARVRPDVSLTQAQAELDSIADDMRRQYAPNMDSSIWGLSMQQFSELVVGEIRGSLLVLLTIVGFVLLIACANVANLLLARATTRHKEIAIRTAVGASRLRIIRQLLTESVLLALAGGGLGLAAGYWGVKSLVSLSESRIPRGHEISLDLNVLAFSLGVSLLTGILFGLVPAFQIAKTDLHEALKEGGRTGERSARHWLRNGLVVIEMAFALMVLIGAGLLLKSFLRLQQVDPGFQPGNILSMQLSLPELSYSEPSRRDALYRDALQRIRALPGVDSAGAISVLPMSGANSSGSFRIEGRPVVDGEPIPHGARWSASSDYFETMGIRLIKGRFFDERDSADAPGVAIIDEALAQKYWPGDDPLGGRITFEGPPDNRRWRTIVGIVGHVKHQGLEGESRAQYYIPLPQRPPPGMFFIVKTSGAPAGLAGPVRDAIRSVDSELPVFRVTPMEQLVSDSMAQRRLSMVLVSIFAAVALALASIGLYGVMAYSVTQRTHEIGIRMALGAERADVLRLIVRGGFRVALVGLIIGCGAAFGLTRFMSAMLFNVSATDVTVFAGIPLVLAIVALAASYVPARRATKVDPIVALRCE